MRLTVRVRDRTLLLRQGLPERTRQDPLEMVAHLVGLQAQDALRCGWNRGAG